MVKVAIWIGPAQQTGNPCPLVWPILPGSQCLMSAYQTWANITLRNITITQSNGEPAAQAKSPGVLIGNISNPMQNIVFDNVVVKQPGLKPWGNKYYDCEGFTGFAKGTTFPVPPCFQQIP